MHRRMVYEAIAKAIRENTDGSLWPMTNTTGLIKSLVTYFKETNPRFDEEKFKEACYGTRTEG